MAVRGVRGATTVDANTKDVILGATRELLRLIVEANEIDIKDVAAAFFTTTSDLNADFPAAAARQLGWVHAALISGHEMNVPGSLPMCIRVLILLNTDKTQEEIQHIYIKGAKNLRGPVDPPND
jgi:chorismate mutase